MTSDQRPATSDQRPATSDQRPALEYCAEKSSLLFEDIFSVPSATPNFRTELAKQLADLISEAVADGKLDIEKLPELLADDIFDNSEHFGLFWPGKKRALRAAQATTTILKPDFDHSNWLSGYQHLKLELNNSQQMRRHG